MNFFSNVLLAIVAACSLSSCNGEKGAIAASTANVEVASECDPKKLSAPEVAMCKDRAENCYAGRNSQSLICNREFSDLTLTVKPAELIEIDGVLERVDGSLFLKGSAKDGDEYAVSILPDSCLKEEMKNLCSLPDESKATLIGAYYSLDGPSDSSPRIVGRMLVLDFFEGSRTEPPPVE